MTIDDLKAIASYHHNIAQQADSRAKFCQQIRGDDDLTRSRFSYRDTHTRWAEKLTEHANAFSALTPPLNPAPSTQPGDDAIMS